MFEGTQVMLCLDPNPTMCVASIQYLSGQEQSRHVFPQKRDSWCLHVPERVIGLFCTMAYYSGLRHEKCLLSLLNIKDKVSNTSLSGCLLSCTMMYEEPTDSTAPTIIGTYPIKWQCNPENRIVKGHSLIDLYSTLNKMHLNDITQY